MLVARVEHHAAFVVEPGPRPGRVPPQVEAFERRGPLAAVREPGHHLLARTDKNRKCGSRVVSGNPELVVPFC